MKIIGSLSCLYDSRTKGQIRWPVAFWNGYLFQITRRMCYLESCQLTVITRNMKTIFIENFSSWSPDSGEIFKIIILLCGPGATYYT